MFSKKKKTIIHFQIPLIENCKNGKSDNFAVNPNTVGLFLKKVKESLGDDYIVIATPFKCSVFGFDEDVKNITAEEFNSLVEKES